MRISLLAIAAVSLFFQGCANIDSISRTTKLPDKSGIPAKAIHLDAKQRIVVGKAFGAVCAEPSPDAVSAFAASLGTSVSLPGTGAGTLSTAFASTVGSIGLRTQSITLMRDALYRICEAYYSRALTGPAVTTLLAQSQNLTTAILAMEQLTGPVAAQQVILASEASARASASVNEVQAELDAAKRDETQKKEARDRANADAATVDPSETEAKTAADKKAADAQTEYDEAKKNREQIERNQNRVRAEANAAASGEGEFSAPGRTVQLNAEASKEIAKAVRVIATTAINRSYVVEGCIALMTDNPPKRENFLRLREGMGEEEKAEATRIGDIDFNLAKDGWESARKECLTVIRNHAVKLTSAS